MLANKGEHGFFDAVVKTSNLDIAMDDDVAVRVESRRKYVTYNDAAR